MLVILIKILDKIVKSSLFLFERRHPGYTLTRYTVEGTLLNSNGEPVTELSPYIGTYTAQSDVILTAKWEVTKG